MNISLVFSTQSDVKVSEEVRLNSRHYFIVKISNKRELHQIAITPFFIYKQSKIETTAPKISNLLNNFKTICWGEQETKIKQSTVRTD